MDREIDLNETFADISPPAASMVTFRADLSALDAMKVLTERHILGAPVIEVVEHHHDVRDIFSSKGRQQLRLLGLLDVIDLCAYSLTVIDKLESTATQGDSNTWKFMFDNILRGKTVKDLMNFSKCNYTYPLESKATFRQVLENLCTKKVHRVVVLDGADLKRIVTQSDVVRFISQHLDSFGSELDVPAFMVPAEYLTSLKLKWSNSLSYRQGWDEAKRWFP
jgi:CBS domain-containing protein